MERPAPRPGPHDRSSPMVWPVLGVIAGLVIYLITLALPGVHNGDNVIYFVIAGAAVGFVIFLLRRRTRR